VPRDLRKHLIHPIASNRVCNTRDTFFVVTTPLRPPFHQTQEAISEITHLVGHNQGADDQHVRNEKLKYDQAFPTKAPVLPGVENYFKNSGRIEF
jgi:hypothetical protein